jgi:hypothetical protein
MSKDIRPRSCTGCETRTGNSVRPITEAARQYAEEEERRWLKRQFHFFELRSISCGVTTQANCHLALAVKPWVDRPRGCHPAR